MRSLTAGLGIVFSVFRAYDCAQQAGGLESAAHRALADARDSENDVVVVTGPQKPVHPL